MKAAVTIKAGGAEEIIYQDVPTPVAKEGWVQIKIKAFGLNRSEFFTRRGESPGVTFPRIQGIECVGEILDDPSGTYPVGQKVAAIMGGMGRYIDGSYAEYMIAPLEIVFPFESTLPWGILGAVPEMFQTTSGSLVQALEVKAGEVIMIRGGTSSVGMMACQLAKHYGLTVVSTTRNPEKVAAMKANGADHVLIDEGTVSDQLRSIYPSGVHKVLELLGTTTLKDSLKCIAPKGMVCMTGILGGEWTLKEFTPMGDIPQLGRLTVYMGEAEDLDKNLLQDFINAVQDGSLQLNIGRHFKLDQVREAHIYMESNQSKGKIVVEI